MGEHDAHGLTRRQIIAGGTAALAAVAVVGQNSYAATDVKPQPTGATPNKLDLVTKDELKAWTVDFLAGLTEGKPLSKCLDFCAARTKNDYLRRVTENILTMVAMGYTLSDAMEMNRSIFTRTYVTTVRYGESYGILDETLEKMLAQWDQLRLG